MKLWLVSYANRRYAGALEHLVKSARSFGFDQIRAFNERHLQLTDFFQQHHEILSQPHGAGYWLWKPYYVAQVLQEAAPDDIVVYTDAAIEFVADVRPLVEICQSGPGPLLFQTHDHANSAWTKRDCFVAMDCDTPRFHSAQQVMGGLQFYRRCSASIEFVDSLLRYCCHKNLLTDAPNECGLPNYPDFITHRHDQSILSLLAEKWGLTIYRAPTQYGNSWALEEFRIPGRPVVESVNGPYKNSLYPQIVNLHRCRKGPAHNRSWRVTRALRSLFDSSPQKRRAA